MRIVAISDMHGKFNEITHNIPDGDVLVVAGDFTKYGSRKNVQEFSDWISQFPHENKIIVAGNHDWAFEKKEKRLEAVMHIRGSGSTYLQDSGIQIGDFYFYGSPWQPEFNNWAFNLPAMGDKMREVWAKIPDRTNVLITHGPPFGIRDASWDARRYGSVLLKERVFELLHLKAHIFGHIHEGYGRLGKFHNVSICTFRYRAENKPTIIEV